MSPTPNERKAILCPVCSWRIDLVYFLEPDLFYNHCARCHYDVFEHDEDLAWIKDVSIKEHWYSRRYWGGGGQRNLPFELHLLVKDKDALRAHKMIDAIFMLKWNRWNQ